MSSRPFNPWAVPNDPFPPSYLGAMEEGEVRYVSIERLFVTPPPLGILWVSRDVPASQVQTHHNLAAIELKDGIYWSWLSPREYQLVIDGEPAEPTAWAVSLRIACEVTRPGIRPPADRPQPWRSPVTDPHSPAATNPCTTPFLVLMATTDPDWPSETDACGTPAGHDVAADCSQDVTIHMHANELPDTNAASSHHDAGGGGWADGGAGGGDGGGAFSCGSGL